MFKTRPNSHKTYSDLCEVIPGGVNSPVRAARAMQMTPLVVDHAYQDTIVDVDGHKYIDYCMSWGALIHGHAHPDILHSASKLMQKGTSFGATTGIEEQLARTIVRLMPSCQKVRFVSSGSEATMSAIRLARGYTARPLILTFSGCYHGHADYFLVKAGSGVSLLPESSSKGIPDELVQSTVQLPFNDIHALETLFKDQNITSRLACVILEPIAANMGLVPANQAFLQILRQKTAEIGALLIFDEVISGFRVGLNGAQGISGIVPDLTCFAKIVGGGFPLAGFGGRHDIMDLLAPLGPVYQGGTLSGNPVAAGAGLKALELLQEPNFYARLQEKADIIIEPVRKKLTQSDFPACIQSEGSLFTIFFGQKRVENSEQAKQCDPELYKKFFRYMFEHGIYIAPLQFEALFVSMAHTQEHLEYTRDAILDFLDNYPQNRFF